MSATELPQETLEFAHRMFDAARNGQTELLQAALASGLPANLTNDGGNTLLMLAAYAGHVELTKSLIDRGGDPNRINDKGQSIVAGAVFKGHSEIVRILMGAGADPRIGTPTAIQTARVFKREDLFEVLGVKDEDLKEHVPSIPTIRMNGQ
ncbi:ankyrin [Cristinia sonorae]|uniref:Ankyrin n=1 Tax=Cristinia sonorae TaxID=1940300 RepID=A0A8K0UX18_9AGAR|nr:ankyrin [Cristinia sonorae]